MTWVKLDDSLPSHPKIHALSDAAFRTYINGLCYAGRHLTDGFLAETVLKTLGKPRTKQQLLDAGLWEKTDGGVLIRDYLDYNPPREKVKERRKKTTERVADWRRRNAVGNDVGNGVTEDGVTTLVTLPPSRPVPSNVSSTKKRVRDECYDALVAAMGREPATRSERGAWNDALKQIREADGTPEQIGERVAAYRREWPDVELTPSALAKHWSRFAAARVETLKPHACECGLRFTSAARLTEHRENVHGEWANVG